MGYHYERHYPASLIAYYLLHSHQVFATYPHLDRGKLLSWLREVEAAYPSSNPYHTALHAADVTASLHYFLSQPRLAALLTPLDWLAALCAAIAHDVGHPGVNNGFLEATRADLAVTCSSGGTWAVHPLGGRRPLGPPRPSEASGRAYAPRSPARAAWRLAAAAAARLAPLPRRGGRRLAPAGTTTRRCSRTTTWRSPLGWLRRRGASGWRR